MNRIIISKKIISRSYFTLGFIITCLIISPYIFLGENSLTRIHDTLDMGVANLVALIRSGNVFHFNAMIDNVMNGLPHSSFASPFYVVVWIFLIFKPFTAYVINELLVHVIAFTGMFLLLDEHFRKNNEGMFIVFGCSLCFAFLPFMPQLGLTVAGQPLLLYAFLNLLNNKQNKSNFAIIFIYPFYSYLVLSGLFIIIALGLLFLWDCYRNEKLNKLALFGLMTLVFAYGIVEHILIKDYLLNTGFISHRTEWNLQWGAYSFKEAIGQAASLLIHEQTHAVSLHTPILFSFILSVIILIEKKIQETPDIKSITFSLAMAFCVAFSFWFYVWNFSMPIEPIREMYFSILHLQLYKVPFFNPILDFLYNYLFFVLLLIIIFLFSFLCVMIAINKKNNLINDNTGVLLLTLMAIMLGTSLFYGFCHWSSVISIREKIALLNAFQLDRFYMLHPLLWYLIFTLSLLIISRIRHGKYIVFLFIIFQMYYLVVNNNQNYNQLLANINATYYKIKGVNIEPEGLTFKKYFSENLFSDIKNYIAIPQKEYRVVSIGLHPCISTYNGFYALDGYIANYPLEYKHQFRKIIENELAKSKRWQEYFDFWGSRCYIFVAELDKFWFENTKDNQYQITNMKLNMDQLKSMGGKYILSVFRIMNEKDNGLVLAKVFERNDSPWRIYLYKIK
ncbi:MAG: DUF6044 family protein [Smithella sp.]